MLAGPGRRPALELPSLAGASWVQYPGRTEHHRLDTAREHQQGGLLEYEFQQGGSQEYEFQRGGLQNHAEYHSGNRIDVRVEEDLEQLSGLTLEEELAALDRDSQERQNETARAHAELDRFAEQERLGWNRPPTDMRSPEDEARARYQ